MFSKYLRSFEPGSDQPSVQRHLLNGEVFVSGQSIWIGGGRVLENQVLERQEQMEDVKQQTCLRPDGC
ncbi:hypothetical protein AGABI1DRAFT_120062 [Agaricus bisporus var. burnettii JB137-S8]|uniref:Uncharacterized protein n=1 Tax=Agaricus bisporus var. burnettii (strain JB137-S8 / ATCC MYA-4627 / FGSC 10392) TaxID=597362 RepID=K5X9W6_AGABU|nr:uncharacterized protein AGABI1DRAFT_120062 [Agaricus bisporus var. burnettii JB137-S8]EKM80028.1 hypothetical protein AGABI1DRAFT_120062 [Agaricus bisporus var. burnettii JB137-S8]